MFLCYLMGYCNGMRALSRMRDRTGELGQLKRPALMIVGDRDAPFLQP